MTNCANSWNRPVTLLHWFWGDQGTWLGSVPGIGRKSRVFGLFAPRPPQRWQTMSKACSDSVVAWRACAEVLVEMCCSHWYLRWGKIQKNSVLAIFSCHKLVWLGIFWVVCGNYVSGIWGKTSVLDSCGLTLEVVGICCHPGQPHNCGFLVCAAL